MYIKHLLTVVILLIFTNISAQYHDDHEHTQTEEDGQLHSHDHEHPLNELGVATNAVYLGGEGEIAFGIHVHYLRSFEDSKFGAGIGYEQIFDEHTHKTIGIIGSYRLIEPLFFYLSPGIRLPGSESPNISFVMHAEATYEFVIHNFHFGPAIGLASDFDEYHASAGFHFAFGF